MAKKSEFRVCLSKAELHDRGPLIWGLVKTLVRKPTDVFPIAKTQTEKLVWAVQKSYSNPQGSYKDWRFPTNVDGILANYFEEWTRDYEGGQEFWYLELAYLHLYRTDAVNKTAPEYILLHCEPNWNEEHAIYKQSPHIHIEDAPHPWPKAHIALNVGYLGQVLRDASSLTKALEVAVIMLKNQVLDEINK